MGGLKLPNWLQTWTHAEVLGGTVAGFMFEQCLKDLFKNYGTHIGVTEESESKHSWFVVVPTQTTTTHLIMIKAVIWYPKDKYIEAKIVEFKNKIDIINLNFVIKLMQGNASLVSDAIGIEADFMFYAFGIEASFCASQWYTKRGEKIRAGSREGGELKFYASSLDDGRPTGTRIHLNNSL